MPASDLLFLSPHKMACLGGTVTGTVDATYDADDLVDGDPSFPVKRTGDLSLDVSGVAVEGCNGAVLSHTNLVGGQVCNFTGDFTAAITAPTVPPGNIRLNGYVAFDPVTVDSYTLSIAGHPTPIIIGESFVGAFQRMRGLPSRSNLAVLSYNTPYSGEYGGPAQSRFATARRYGGSVWLDDVQMQRVQDWYDACEENSKVSVILPFPLRDPWVVIWNRFEPIPVAVDVGEQAAWLVNVEWEEAPPRYRWN